MKLADWFHVSFDTRRIRLDVAPPGNAAWQEEFLWSEIVRVCFKAEDLSLSDGIYVFTTRRPESYVIPTEADGGPEFFDEILRRNLFNPTLALQALLADTGLFCWPPN